MAVAIDGEFFSAGWTSKDVDGLPLHQIKVAVPPLIPASVTAEPFPLPSGILCNGPAALLAYCPVCSGCQTVPPAERLHCVDGNLELRRYPAIPCPIPAQGDNLLFLFVRHDGHLLKIWSSGVTGQNSYR
jgi:hypothetical protein